MRSHEQDAVRHRSEAFVLPLWHWAGHVLLHHQHNASSATQDEIAMWEISVGQRSISSKIARGPIRGSGFAFRKTEWQHKRPDGED